MSTCCDPVPVNATQDPPEVLIPANALIAAPIAPLDGDDYAVSTDTLTAFKRTLWSDVASWILGVALVSLPVVGSVARTVLTALTDNISVKWFGARGDGVTDDTAALQVAANYCASTGKTMCFPAGIYVHSAAILVGSSVRGEGPRSVLKCTTLDFAAGAGSHRQLHFNGASDFTVSDMAFDAAGLTGFLGGMRSILLVNCTGFWIDRVKFLTPGAATAAIGCSRYNITGLDITCSSTDGVIHHDGVVDQWGGSHDFKVVRVRIDGGGIARYGVLVTGEDTAGVAAACYNFDVVGNTVVNCKSIGIWLNGREGTNYNFKVTRNTVDTVADFFGIAVSDGREGDVSHNIVKNTARNGIRFYSETTEGGVLGVLNVTAVANTIRNANTSANANDLEGAAFAVASPSAGNVIADTRVVGATHRNAIYFQPGTARNRELGTLADTGVLSAKVIDASNPKANYPSYGVYVPTLTGAANVAASTAYQANYTVEGDHVTVYFKISVTPTAAASTATQINISLPIPSNLSNLDVDLHGTASSAFGLIASIYSDTSNDRAQLQFPASNVVANSIFGSFRYRLL